MEKDTSDAQNFTQRILFNRQKMTDEDAPPGDIQVSDVFSDTNVIGVIGFKSSEDLEQRKWFNAAMKKANHGGLNKVLCAEKEETLDTAHAELCNIFHHAIRLSVKDNDEARKHFFISKELEGTFNQGTLMKTRHTEKNLWSIVKSNTLELRLNRVTISISDRKNKLILIFLHWEKQIFTLFRRWDTSFVLVFQIIYFELFGFPFTSTAPSLNEIVSITFKFSDPPAIGNIMIN